MDKRRQQGVNHSDGRQRNPQRIHNQRPVEVLENHRTAPTSGSDGSGELPEIVSDQKHTCARMCDFGPATHRYSYLGAGKSGSIIDAVSDHGHCSAKTDQ